MAKRKTKKTGWYQTGKEGNEKASQVDAQAKARRDARGPMRFRLNNDSAAKVTFVDTPSFFFSEHNLNLNNSWNNFFTCLSDFDDCPPCADGDNASYVVVGTVIDHSEYAAKDGTVYKDQKKLFVAKGKARQNLLRQISRRDGDLAFKLYEIFRGSNPTECGTGETLEFLKEISKASLKKYIKKQWDKEGKEYKEKELEEFLLPFDYTKIFAPKSPEELRKIIGGEVPTGADDDLDLDSDDDLDLEDDKKTEEKEPESIDDLL